MTAPRARWSVWVQLGERRQDLQPADHDLDARYRTADHDGEPDERRMVALGPPGDDRDGQRR